MIMLDHMKALAKENNICTYMNKDEIIGLLLLELSYDQALSFL